MKRFLIFETKFNQKVSKNKKKLKFTKKSVKHEVSLWSDIDFYKEFEI